MPERRHLDIYVANLDCENEAAAITRGLQAAPGVFDLRVYPKAAKVTLEYDPATVSPDSLRDKLRTIGFPPQQGRSLAVPASDQIERLQTDGKTVVVVGTGRRPWGLIAIRDQVRPNAKRAITDLHAAGIQKVVMLTGDNRRTAEAIAREVGIDEVFSDLKPEDKVAKVRELASRDGRVAMVGDGVNDAPALAEATVGIAMGAAGTDVALETADVALMADDLEKFVYALQLAKRNQRVVGQNLALSAVVIGSLVIGAVAGWLTLPIAVLGHEISEFVVIGSGLRMLKG